MHSQQQFIYNTFRKIYFIDFPTQNVYIGLTDRACMYTRTQCTVADYFCQGMQLKKFGHFYRAPVFKIPLPIQTFGTRLFSAFAH